MRNILKIVVSGMCVVFFISSAYSETIWEKRQRAVKGIEEKQEEAIKKEVETPVPLEEDEDIFPEFGRRDIMDLTIPGIYGSILETHKGTNGKTIVHIQDAHANYEAQKNIAGIMEMIMRDYNISLIFREGGSTDKDFTYLRKDASLDARIRAAEKLLKDTVITAIDYVNLATDYPMTIQGMEDRKIYDENRFAILEMDKFRDIAKEYVKGMALSADTLKGKIYNEPLIALDKAKKDYEIETADLLTYYQNLNDIAQKNSISIEEYPNFSLLIKINDMEKNIDFIKATSPDATEDEKRLYAEYQKALKELNVNKLFKEEPLIENKIRDAICENNDQRALFRISKAIFLMGKMLDIKLVPEEYEYFLQNKKDFDPNLWKDFLTKKSEELGLGLKIPENSYALTDNMPIIEKVYSTAWKRDSIFVQKVEERMEKDNLDKAILVAGGFHTPTLTRLLNEAGYSYIVISPRVTTKTDDNVYKESLKGEWEETE